MQKIKQLSSSEIQKIAAGQVVERPANVVKELLENALDAGAIKISLYIKNGGHDLIRVVDNGCGMSPEDALVCFERHATSKISSVDELMSLTTFGFRGEALYTIGAVSNVTLVTKEMGAQDGVQIQFHQGALIETTSVAAQQGTDITVSDLFVNVPVRKKFLKKEETEWRAIVTLFQAFCCAYPALHFQLFMQDKLAHNCPPVNALADRGAQLWEQNLSNAFITVQHETQHASFQGVITHHTLYRYNRNQIFFFVNNRWVRNYALMQALLKGYLNVLPHGKFPAAIIHITVDPQTIDVNIHPRKEEIAFVHAHKIEQALTGLVKKSLEAHLSSYMAPQLQDSHLSRAPQPLPQSFFNEKPFAAQPFSQPLPQPFFNAPVVAQEAHDYNKAPFEKQIEPLLVKNEAPLSTFSSEVQGPLQNTITMNNEKQEYTILGVLKKTYIMVDHPEGMVMIDQHAAHERVLYEKFSSRLNERASISLLFPEIITMNNEDIDLIMRHSLLLHEYGILFDQFGAQQLIITSIPVYLKSIKWLEFMQEYCALIQEQSNVPQQDFLKIVNHQLQAQMACKAAIKAGDDITHEQIMALLQDLNSLENRFTCPHGRPTSWLLSTYEIEKKFKRKK